MTHLAQHQGAIPTRYRYRTHQNLQLEIPERPKTTRTQASKLDTHLGITIRWGVPRVARRARDGLRAAGSC
jgi:hypothetical protein